MRRILHRRCEGWRPVTRTLRIIGNVLLALSWAGAFVVGMLLF